MSDRIVISAPAYLVVRGDRTGRTGGVIRATVVRARQSRPETLGSDEIVVKLTLSVPVGVFEPLATVVISIPEDLIQRGPIEVEVFDAAEPVTS